MNDDLTDGLTDGLSPFQQRIAKALNRGCRLQKRYRQRGFGLLWDYPVVVVVDLHGEEVMTVPQRTLERLRAAGYALEIDDPRK